MNFLPLFHALQDRPCVVVGGNEAAWRKTQWLLKAGARVTVIAPDVLPCLQAGVLQQGGACIPCNLDNTDTLTELLADQFSDCVLAIAATDNHDCNRLVSALANMLNIPVNVVDEPSLCTFVFPSIIERGALTVAISTGGNAPVIARLLRARLESWLPTQLENMINVAGSLRDTVRDLLPEPRQRRRFWDAILQDSLIGAAGEGSTTLDEPAVLAAAQSFLSVTPPVGVMDTLVVDSPEPDHLRFFQLRVLQAADILLFDDNVPASILDLARRDADRVCTDSATAQSLAAAKLAQGLRVVTVHFKPVDT